jgi:MFS family permease
VGDELVVVAIALYVTDLSGPAAVGLVLAAYTVPFVLFLVVGGVWGDRLQRQRLMATTDLVRFVLHLMLAILIFTGAIEIWHMVVIGALFGTAHAFFLPAYQGLVPQTVPPADVQGATALGTATINIAELLGPGLATALVLGVGAGWAFALDAATFAVSATLLIKIVPQRAAEPAERSGVWRELVEGFGEVRSRPWVWVTIVSASLTVLVWFAPLIVLGPQHSKETWGTSAVFGVLMVTYGVGAVAGSLVAARLRPRRPLVWGTLAILPWPVNIAFFAVGAPEPVVYATGVLGGMGFSFFDVWWSTAMVEHIPPGALSRVTAWDYAGSFALLPLGYVIAGPIGESVGEGTALTVGSIAGTILLLAALLPRSTRELRWVESGADDDRGPQFDAA